MKLWIIRASHNGYVCPGASVFRAFAGCHNVTHMSLRKIRCIRMPKQSWSTVWPYHRFMVSNHHSPPLNCLFWFRPSCKSHWVVNWPHPSTSALSWFCPQPSVHSHKSQHHLWNVTITLVDKDNDIIKSFYNIDSICFLKPQCFCLCCTLIELLILHKLQT